MIQPLRAVHRRAFVALAVVLPAILLIGLGARRPRLGPSAHATDVRGRREHGERVEHFVAEAFDSVKVL